MQVLADAELELVGDGFGVPAGYDARDEVRELGLGAWEQAGDDALRCGLEAAAGAFVFGEKGSQVSERPFEKSEGAAVRACGVGLECQAHAGPDVPQPGLDRFMGDNATDGAADLGGACRVVFHAVDLAVDPFVEGQAESVALGMAGFGDAAGVDTVEFGAEDAEDAVGYLCAEDPTDELAALGADLVLDELVKSVVPGLDPGAELLDEEVEHFLVSAALDKGPQRAGDDDSGAGAAEQAGGEAAHGTARATVLDSGEEAGEHFGKGLGGGPGGVLVEKEAGEDGRDVEAGEDAADFGGGDDVPGDEAAESAAEAHFLAGDDGGVGDGDAERVAEEGGDGEPIGDAADEAGLGAGLEEFGPEGRE